MAPKKNKGTEIEQHAQKVSEFATWTPEELQAMSPEEKRKLAEDLDLEIKLMERQTAFINLEKSKEDSEQYFANREAESRRRKNAQDVLRQEQSLKENTQESCAHRVGGFGLDDFFDGDGKTAIIIMELPVHGMRFAMCTRCGIEATTPDPKLKLTDPEAYIEQMQRYKFLLKLFKQSYNAKPISGPTFTFTQDGMPVRPTIR